MTGISRFRWVILKIILNVMMKSYTALPGLLFPVIDLEKEIATHSNVLA